MIKVCKGDSAMIFFNLQKGFVPALAIQKLSIIFVFPSRDAPGAAKKLTCLSITTKLRGLKFSYIPSVFGYSIQLVSFSL